MVTHLSIAGGDAVTVEPSFRRSPVVPAGVFTAAAAARVAVRSARTGSAVLARAVGLWRGVRVLRNGTAAAVMVLLGTPRGDGGGPIRAVRLRHIIRVFGWGIGAVVDVVSGQFRSRAAVVRARRLNVVVVAVRRAGVELSCVRGCWGHDHL